MVALLSALTFVRDNPVHETDPLVICTDSQQGRHLAAAVVAELGRPRDIPAVGNHYPVNAEYLGTTLLTPGNEKPRSPPG